MAPEVSVVITCYNYGRYVAGCLESVLAQSFEDFEIILVDDGSTDNSEEQIKPFLQDSRLRYIKQKNGGQANAKNRGIHEASGRFVAFLDADDQWGPAKLAKQLPLFSDEKVGVVYSRARYIDEDGLDLYKEIEELGGHFVPQSGRVVNHLLFDNFVPFSSSVVRLELLGAGFDKEIKMAIDWKLWLSLALEWDFAFVNEKLLYYRVGHSGQMSKNAEERFRCTDTILDEFLASNEGRIGQNAINSALAHKYYLRWEYFRGRDARLARQYLGKALRYKLDLVRVTKGLLKSLLFVKD